ncbi:MFS transporter [Janibacter sp. G349]|uniref:MFS transporter n=1 Tax=unclassified Janibacter TaxID=2649294 RepID=UPI003B7D4EAB
MKSGTAVDQDASAVDTSDNWSAFWKLWTGSTATLYVEQFISFAIPLLLVTQAGASVAFGQFVTFLYFVPYLLIGLNAGVWLEGRSHFRSLSLVAVAQTGLLAVLMTTEAADQSSMFVYIAFVLVSGFIAVFFQISFQSSLPQILTRGQSLYLANSRLALSDSVTRVIGPASAGVFIAYLQPTGSVLVVVVLSALAACAFLLIKAPEVAQPPAAKTRDATTGTLIREGLTYVRDHKWLNPIISCGAYYIIFVTAIKATVALYLVDSGKASSAVAGLVISAIAAGYGVGSVAGRKMAGAKGARRTLQVAALISTIGASAASATALLVTDSAVVAWVCSLGMLVHGIGDGMFAPTALSVRQIATPDHFMSRVTSVHRFFIWGGMSLGGLAAAVVTFLANPSVTLAAMAIGVWGTLPVLYRRNLSVRTHKGEVGYECDP